MPVGWHKNRFCNLRMATRRPGYDPSPVGFIPPSELSESELDNIKENFVMFDKDGDGAHAPPLEYVFRS